MRAGDRIDAVSGGGGELDNNEGGRVTGLAEVNAKIIVGPGAEGRGGQGVE